MKIDFENACCPMLVPSNKNESGEDFHDRWNKFDALSEQFKDKLSSVKTIDIIKNIVYSFKLSSEAAIIVSKTIRSYYFGEVHLEDFPSILYKEMGIDLNTAKEISQIVIQKIINDNSQEKAYQTQLEKISLPEALAKYPTVADQFATSAQIRIRGGQELVRPTIKNWLADYTYSVGYDAHSSIVRGNYMFQNENTKRLSPEDRNKLTYILKSYDEKTPITVDTARKQIVFPAMPAPNAATHSPSESMSSNEVRTNDPDVRVPHFDLRQNSETLPRKSQPARSQQNNLEKNYEHYQIPQRKPADLPVEHKQDISENIREVRFGSSEFRPEEKPEIQKENNLVFSSPQKLPFEREKEEKFSAPDPMTPPVQVSDLNRKVLNPEPSGSIQRIEPTRAPQIAPKPFAPERPQAPIEPEPLHIRPASQHDEEREELPRNVVNLKEQ